MTAEWLPTDETPVLDAALAYAAHGFTPVVVYGLNRDTTCQCGRASCTGKHRAKHPIGNAWQRDATRDPDTLRSRFDKPGRNIGLKLGPELICLDIDGVEGQESRDTLETENDPLPSTLTDASGNGQHLFFRLAAHHDASKVRNRRIRPGLDVKINNGQVVVAPSTHWTGRVYRWTNRTEVAELPDWLYAIVIADAPRASAPSNVVAFPSRLAAPSSVSRRARAYLAEMPPAIEEQRGHDKTFEAACAMVCGFNLDTEAAYRLLAEEFNPRCRPAWSEQELRHKVASATSSPRERGYLLNVPLQRTGITTQRGTPRMAAHDADGCVLDDASGMAPIDLLRQGMTADVQLGRGDHVDLARQLLETFGTPATPVVGDLGELYRYDATRGVWCVLDRGTLSREVQSYSGAIVGDGDKRKPLKLKASDVNGAISLATEQASSPGFFAAERPGIAFSDVFVEVSASGILTRPHAPEHRARHGYSFPYSPQAEPTRWLAFLHSLFRDDEDREGKIAVVQEFFGGALLGIATRYQKCIVALGEGENGKSKMAQILTSLFPPNSTTAITPEKLEHEYSLAQLAGKRLNVVSEMLRTNLDATQKFKAAVAGDAVQGRFIYQKEFTFQPTAAHFFAANELPGTADQSDGFWRRFILLKFNRSFKDDPERDPLIAEKIINAEQQLIVSWLLDGAARLFRQDAYTDMESHRAELTRWRFESDPVALWLEEETRAVPIEAGQLASDLYRAYRAWAISSRYAQLTANSFGRQLARLGVDGKHSREGKTYPRKLKHDASWR